MTRRSQLTITGACLSAAAAVVTASVAAFAAVPSPVTELVSRDSGAAGAVSDGHEPALNGNGRYVAFESAGNFGGLNGGATRQIWLRDRTLNTTQLVSRVSGAAGAAGDGVSGGSSVSADGRYVVFDSDSANLISAARATTCSGPGGASSGDVFLRDMQLGTTTLISHAAGLPLVPGNDFSTDPLISPDGSTITYASRATDLSLEAQTNPTCILQVIAYRVATGTATIVSRASNTGPVLGAEGSSQSDSRGAMSTDGSVIAFSSVATNLTATATGGNEQVYVRDLTTGTTTLVSRANGAAGAASDSDCSHPTITSDGTRVAMSCAATNLAAGTGAGVEEVYIRNRTANTITLISTQTPGGAPSAAASSPVMSSDGSLVVYESDDSVVNAGSTDTQVVATDVATGVNTIVSRADGAAGAVGDNSSTDIAVNADGSVVAWESVATNLTADTPAGGAPHAFVRGAVPTLATATPTAIPVPATGAAQAGGGWPGLGLLALTGGITMAGSGAALLARRRQRNGDRPRLVP